MPERPGAENNKQSQNAERLVAPDTLARDMANAFAACPFRHTPFMHADLASPEDEFILRQQASAQLSAISNEYTQISDGAVKAAARKTSEYRETIKSAASWLAGTPKGGAQGFQNYKKDLVLRARAVADDPNIDPAIKQDFLNSLQRWVIRC